MSLKDCFGKIAGFEPDDKRRLIASTNSAQGRGLSHDAAALSAVEAELAQAETELQVVKDAIVAAGGRLPEVAPVKKSETNTEDSGSELTANKRNRTSRLSWEDIKDKDAALRVRETTKSKVYPRPDYQPMVDGGMQPLIAHIVKQAYDALASKPNTRAAPTDEQLESYIAGVNRYMDGVMAWANDRGKVGAFIHKLAGKAKVLQGASSGVPTSLSSLDYVAEKSMLETVYPDGWRNSIEEVRLIGGNKILSALQPSTDEAMRAMKEIDKGWPSSQEAWQRQGYRVVNGDDMTTSVYAGTRTDGTKYAAISYKLDGRTINTEYVEGAERESDASVQDEIKSGLDEIKGKYILINKNNKPVGAFDSEADAQNKARELTAKGGKKTISDKGISVTAAERVGADRRMEGEDISSDKLRETFGFKGINFGNWMKGKGNEAERQLHLNHAYDSFMDLAEILGVPPKAMSLNGMLGLAIGAQGTGQYAAHFVPGVNEINLTRTSGAGSLAHEFAHAVDHYFARLAGLERKADPWLTSNVALPSRPVSHTEIDKFHELRVEILSGFKAIIKSMNTKPETEAERNLRRETAIKRAEKNVNGWLDSIRRDFIRDKVDEKAFDALADKVRNLDLGDGMVMVSSKTALHQTIAELRDLYAAAAKRPYSLDRIVGMQNNVDHLKYLNSDEVQASEHIPQTSTDYSREAAKLDKDKGGKPYWNTPWEKFARAFDAYVSDKLEAKAAKNTYLSHAGRDDETVPKGEERKVINAAFDKLVGELKTKETGQGTALFSRRARAITGDDTMVSAALSILARNDELFQMPVSEAKDMAGIAKDVFPRIKVVEHGRDGARTFNVSSHRAWTLSLVAGDGKKQVANAVELPGREIYLNVSDFKEGGSGNAIYHIIANYAHNNGLVFVGDPYGLSDAALYRRTENMLASALKFGTTKHLAPHERQIEGDADLGVPPLEWEVGNDAFNISKLSDVSYASLAVGVPELANIKYNFDAHRIEDADGNEFSDKRFVELAARPRAREARAGRDTLKRGALLNTLVQTGRGDERGRVLGELLRQSREHLDPALRNIFYSRETRPRGGLSVSAVEKIITPVIRRWKNAPDIRVVQSVEEIPESAVPHDVEGAYFGNGRLYLVADNLPTRARVLQVLAHEAVGHTAMEEVFGAELPAILREVKLMERAGNRAVREAAQTVDENQPGLGEQDRAKEIIAVMAERGVHNSLVNRVLAAIRRFLRSIGIDLEFSDADLAGLIRDAERYLESGETGPAAGAAVPAYSKTGPTDAEKAAIQMYSDGESMRGIAKKVGVDHKTVSAWLDKNEVVKRIYRRPEILKAEAISLYNIGKSQYEIADALGVQQATVGIWLRNANVEIRGKPYERAMRDEVVRLYVGEELSAEEVGNRLSIPTVSAMKILRDAGVTRTRSEAAAIRSVNKLPGTRTRGVPLSWKSDKAGGWAIAHSRLEAARMAELDADNDVESWSRNVDRVSYVSGDGKTRTYVADFLITYKDGRRIVEEIKPTQFVNDSEVQRRAEAAKKFFSGKGIEFRFVTERDITQASEILDITPAMRESVMQGQALFSRSQQSQPQQIQGANKDGKILAVAVPESDGAWTVYRGEPAKTLFESTNYARRRFPSRAAAEKAMSEMGLQLRYRRPTFSGEQAPALFKGFDVPGESVRDYLIRKLQDKFRRVKITQRLIAERGGVLDEENDAYLAEELFYGRTEDRLRQFNEKYVEPIIESIKDAGVKMEDVDRFLYARHAPERNAHIASINPTLRDRGISGSGMTDAEAADVMADFDQRWLTGKMNDISRLVDRINKARLDLLKQEGLESEETIALWQKPYKHYVPLRGFVEESGDERARTGRGFDIRGSESRRAMGRGSKAMSPLTYTVVQMEESLVRAEKNRVGRTFLKMVESNPNEDLWEINKVEYKPTYNTQTGEVDYRPDPLHKLADNVLSVKVDGRQVLITLHDPLLARALNNVGVEKANVVVRALGAVNRYLAMVNTSLNPEFVLSNFTRDIQTALINLYGEQGAKGHLKEPKGIARKVLKDIPKALAGAYAGLRGIDKAAFGAAKHSDAVKEWVGWFDQYRADGGKIGFFGLDSIEGKMKRINRALKRADGGVAARAEDTIESIGSLIMDINGAVENAVRLATYKNARELGLTRKQAASLARNLTVNFNRKGEMGAVANSLYLFYNASLQGVVRTLYALRSRKVQVLMLGIVGTAFLLSEMNRHLAGDDDDGENFYDKLVRQTPWLLEHNLIIMKPNSGGKYFSIPLPYGYNIPHVLGMYTNQAMHSKRPAKLIVRAMIASANSFNPLGSDAGMLQMISPTITDTAVQIATNENFSGAPIKPPQRSFGVKKPESQLYWSTVSPVSKGITGTLNSLTGGNTVRPGAIDVSPEVLDHVVDTFFGGAGAFVNRSVNYLGSLIKGDDIPARRVPFARRFYGEQSEYYTSRRFSQNVGEVMLAHDEGEALRKQGRREDADKARAEYAPLIRMYPKAKVIDNLVSEDRKRIRDIQARPSLDDKTKSERIEMIRRRMDTRMKRFNRHFNEATGGPD